MKIVYVKYSDPKPFSPHGGRGADATAYRAVFRTGGVIVREDDDVLLIGEQAAKEDNGAIAERFGSDMFPAYRNILPIRKEDIIERIDFEIPVKE
ncbi:MAG: hypothetical protein M1351_05970 [Candidatus Thermoplasmatota archaeon]|nr:hypothetical protein [Candidatus Thermoplasmatota archaeon]